HDGSGLQQFQASGVSLVSFASAPLLAQSAIRSQIASGIRRPRQFMQKTSIERQFGKYTATTEYSWTRSEHLLGSRRLVASEGLLDLLESNRPGAAHRLHSQVTYRVGSQRLVGYYEWAHSHDDTDGVFSFPALQNDLRAEWARTAGVARHTFTFVAM